MNEKTFTMAFNLPLPEIRSCRYKMATEEDRSSACTRARPVQNIKRNRASDIKVNAYV